MIRLLFLIVLFIVYSYSVSQAACYFFPDFLGKLKYKWPIGFFIIIGIIQFVSFPMQYFQVSMQLVSIVYSIVLAVLTVFVVIGLRALLKDRRQQIFKLQTSQFVDYVLIIGFIVFNFVICVSTNSFNDINADQTFYINFVENNIGSAHINQIIPLTGEIGRLDSLYNFQSFYLFLSYVASLFKLDAVLVMAWFVPSLLWLTVATTFLNLISYFKLEKKWWVTAGIFVFLWTFVDLFDYFVRYNIYGNNIRVFVFYYLMIGYLEYMKNAKVRTLILCSLLWLSACAFQSTSLFLGIMMMVAYGLYDVFIHRQKLIIPLLMSSIPIMLYLAFFLGYRSSAVIGYSILTIMALLILLMFSKKAIKLLNIVVYSKGMRWVISITIVLITIVSILMIPHLNPEISFSPAQFVSMLFEKYFLIRSGEDSSRHYYEIVLMLIRQVVILLNIILLVRWKKLDFTLRFLLMIQVIVIVVFYNPFVSGFISTFITGIVYPRIGDIVMALTLICGIIAYGLNNRYLKVVIAVLICFSVSYLGLRTFNYMSSDFNKIDKQMNYNYLYRMNQDLIDTGVFLELYIDHQALERPSVLMTNFEVSYFAHNYRIPYTVYHERLSGDEAYKSTKANLYAMRQAIKYSYEVNESDQLNFRNILEENQIDFIVVTTVIAPWLSETLDSIGNLIYENTSYQIYEL